MPATAASQKSEGPFGTKTSSGLSAAIAGAKAPKAMPAATIAASFVLDFMEIPLEPTVRSGPLFFMASRSSDA
jgi:hypothetical protein